MKKNIVLILFMVLTLAITGCAGKQKHYMPEEEAAIVPQKFVLETNRFLITIQDVYDLDAVFMESSFEDEVKVFSVIITEEQERQGYGRHLKTLFEARNYRQILTGWTDYDKVCGVNVPSSLKKQYRVAKMFKQTFKLVDNSKKRYATYKPVHLSLLVKKTLNIAKVQMLDDEENFREDIKNLYKPIE